MPGFKMSFGAAGGRGCGTPRPASGTAGATLALFREDMDAPAPAATGQIRGLPPPSAAGGGADPLETFMAGLAAEAAACPQTGEIPKKAKAAWEELQSDDPVASYYAACEEGKKGSVLKMKAAKQTGKAAQPDGGDVDSDDEVAAFDSDSGAENDADRRTKPIEPLPLVEHSNMDYQECVKELYTPHPEIVALSPDRVSELRGHLRISTTGTNCPSPVVSFVHLGFRAELMDGIRHHGFEKPTPIQAQAIPAALSGRDVVGIAETGSGKTMAYLLPVLMHSAAQPELNRGEGPIALVLCPTRELGIQIEKEAFTFSKLLHLKSIALLGGFSKYEQFKAIKGGSEVVVATPGRLIDMVKMKGCNLQRCTFVVLDEADRMLNMGFEHQIRSIMQNVRPTRQTLLFSATFPPKIARLSSDILQQPIRITIGKLGQAAENISQFVEVLNSEEDKWAWLSSRIQGMLSAGQILIFCKSKQGAEALAQRFGEQLQIPVSLLHGDLEQDARTRTLEAFRARNAGVLIATDVASRGLDIPTIRTVVSFDVARDVETHTHRVGRTGRAGAEGDAFTLLTSDERRMAALLFEHVEQVGSRASGELLALAMQHPPFRASRLSNRGSQKKRTRAEANESEEVVMDDSNVRASRLQPVFTDPRTDSADDPESLRKCSRSRSPQSPPSPLPTP